MHRTINISLPSTESQSLCDRLAALETVVGVSLSKGISIKPPGNVVTVDILNKGAFAGVLIALVVIPAASIGAGSRRASGTSSITVSSVWT